MPTTKEFFQVLENTTPIDYADEIQRAWYVDNLRGDNDAVGLLAREIDFREGQGVYLFTGQIGSGKSTEMKRLKYELEAQNCTVFYSDLEKWLNPEQAINLGSFLLAIVASWIDQSGSTVGARSPAQRLADFLTKTKINLPSIKMGVAAIGLPELQFALSQDATVVAQVEDALKANKTNFIAQVHAFVETLVAELPAGRKVVLLIDSLEKFRADKKDDVDNIVDSVLTLFQNTQALKLPLVHVVYSISYLVYEQNRQLPAQLGNAFVVNLSSVHVFKRHSDELDLEGLAGMKLMLDKRFPAWRTFFTETQIQDVARKTGGDLRDFLRALQIAIISHRDKTTLAINDDDLEHAFNQIRPSLAINAQHLDWMVRLQKTHSAELDGDIDFNVLNDYLRTKHVLAYLNGQTWYGLHPLISQDVQVMYERYLARLPKAN